MELIGITAPPPKSHFIHVGLLNTVFQLKSVFCHVCLVTNGLIIECRVLFKVVIVILLIEELTTFCRIQMFIAMFTAGCHCAIS